MKKQTPPARRKSRPRSEIHDLIIAAATELFSERGFDGPSIRDIADAADVALPALYRVFVDKRDLYEKCVHLAFERHLTVMQSFLDDADDGAMILFKLTRLGFDLKLTRRIDYRLLNRVALNMEVDDILAEDVVEMRNSDMVQKMCGALEAAGHDTPALRMMILEAVFLQMPTLFRTWPTLEVDPQDTDQFTISTLSVVCPKIDWAKIAENCPAIGVHS